MLPIKLLVLALYLSPVDVPAAPEPDLPAFLAAQAAARPDAGITAPAAVSVAPLQDAAAPSSAMRMLITAVKDKRYGVAAGIALMLTVWMLRRAFPRLPKPFLPLAALIISSGPALAVVVSAPGVTLDEVLFATFSIWATAGGTWAGVIEPIRNWMSARTSVAPSTAPVDTENVATKA